jgi:MOSC domain-containing protein YiiM
MHVSSVNLAAAPSELRIGSRPTRTGIYKVPASGPVEIGPLGLAGDTIWAKKHHGGPDQAVYVYGEDEYAWWERELERELAPGTFGENLTVAGLASAKAIVGDRLHIGANLGSDPTFAAVVLEVTCGRIPCGTLTARMGIRAFAQRFRKAARPGLYCRVISPGTVRAGDAVRYETTRQCTLGVVEFAELFYAEELTREQLERVLAAPICERGRREHEAQLAALDARSP